MPSTMIDVHEVEHHWEELQRRVSDTSVQTVHHDEDHRGKALALATKSAEPLPDELVVLEGQLSPISAFGATAAYSTKESPVGDEKDSVTAYEDVSYRGEVGTLLLSRQRLVFCAHDEQGELPVHPRVHPHHVWNWTSVEKHRISPAKSGKIDLRLALTNGSEETNVAFGLSSREELDRASKDVSQRLRLSKQAANMTPMKPKQVAASSPDGTAETMDTSAEAGELELNLEEPSPTKPAIVVQEEQATEATALLASNTNTSKEVSEEENMILGYYDRNTVLAAAAVAALVAILILILSSPASSGVAGARMLRVADYAEGEQYE